MLLPLCHLSRRRVGGLPAEVSQILNTQIQARTIMTLESRLWLEAIYRRLAGRLRVRNHFKVELSETSPTSFSRVTKSKKVYRGICAVIRVLWRQQKVRNNFIFIIKRAKQLAVFTSLWPDRVGSCAILQEDSHREESWQ